MTVLDELGSLPERIAASSARLIDYQAQVEAERKTRNELIVQAVDHAGISQADVGRAAGISQAHVVRILAGSSAD